nr:MULTISPECIES: Gfo/Idh/MocA family oxidoreductase [unclassified Enterobacter]
MKLGILGTGMIVKDLLSTVNKLPFKSLAILGTQQTEEETRDLACRHNINDIYFDYQDLLDSDVDTIYVALPNHLHFPVRPYKMVNMSLSKSPSPPVWMSYKNCSAWRLSGS